MVKKKGRSSKSKRAVVFDEFGGSPDGGLAIVGADGTRLHMTPARVAASLRYLLARVQTPGPEGLPARIALTAALRGEGVSYITRSLAAVLAYDNDVTVAIVDLNWRLPKRPAPAPSAKAAKAAKAQQAKAAKVQVAQEAKAAADAAKVDATVVKKIGADAGVDSDAAADSTEAIDSAPAGAGTTDVAPGAAGTDATSHPTLVDVVDDKSDLDEAIIETANPRLSLITAGELSLARRPVIAGSRALEDVIDAVAKRFDHVLLDLPPVLASSDAIKLAQLADAFVLVVRQGATATSQVEAALEELRGNEAMGVILNRFESHIPRLLRRMVGA